MNKWQPTPGNFAEYPGRSSSQRRIVKVVAEASAGCMCVEAIGRKGYRVRLTVKRHNLREPQPTLF